MKVAPSYSIQGREIRLPVVVRKARSWAASFLVDAAAAQRLVAPTGLRVARPWPGKALLTLAFVRYQDGDLDAYDEVGVTFLVRAHDAPMIDRAGGPREILDGKLGVYIHHLPVNRTFTLEAGRTIWGYPKFLADIRLDEMARGARWSLEEAGSPILSMDLSSGGWVPMPSQTPPTYTFLDGVLRRTAWTADGRTRGRPGGRIPVLGDHPIADELRGLGLPRRPLMTTTIPRFRVRFGPAQVVSMGKSSQS